MKKYINVNDVTICVDDTEDQDKEPIFLYHGLTDSKEGMYNVRDMLRNDYRVITVDSRGHGESSHPDSYTLQDHAKDFHELVRKLGFKKVNLLGYSMGSYIALASAEMKSDDIDHLILVCTKGSGKTSSTSRVLKEAGYDITTVTPEQMTSIVMEAALAPSSLEKLSSSHSKLSGVSKHPLTPKEKAAEDASVAGFDNLANLDKVTCKTLVIAGEYDGINKPEWGKKVADGIKDSEYVLIKDAGHLVSFEQPEIFEKTIKDFLKK